MITPVEEENKGNMERGGWGSTRPEEAHKEAGALGQRVFVLFCFFLLLPSPSIVLYFFTRGGGGREEVMRNRTSGRTSTIDHEKH